jgi:hypothetical protein
MTDTIDLKPGTRLISTRCSTQVIVVRPPRSPLQLTCGGDPMRILDASQAGTLDQAPTGSSGVILGKRYADDQSGLELLCTRAGAGPLSADGRDIGLKEPKPLPASD